MIVDFSHPRGCSLNDLIPPDACTLSYPSIDDAVDFVVSMGRYTQLVKIDINSAYRILPIHPADRALLGISWEGQVYLDGCFPFGLWSAAKIFTAFPDAVGFCSPAKFVASSTTWMTSCYLGPPSRTRHMHSCLQHWKHSQNSGCGISETPGPSHISDIPRNPD